MCQVDKTVCDTNEGCENLGNNYYCYYPSYTTAATDTTTAMGEKTGYCKALGESNSASVAFSDGTITVVKSADAMNWWSAMTWCRQNDMQLASVTSLCPSSNITEGEGCPNMGDEHTAYFGWTRSLCSDGKSWAIGATIHMRPAIYCGDRTATKVGYKSQYQSALCEEIPAASND